MTNTTLAQTTNAALLKMQAEVDNLRTLRAEKQREVGAIVTRMQALERHMSAIQVATTTLMHWVPPAAEEEWRDHLVAWRETLCEELLALPEQLQTDHELGTQQNLAVGVALIDGVGGINGGGYALENLRLGSLMRASGYVEVGADPMRNYGGELPWFGSLPQVERRIAKLKNERDDAQAQLDAALRDDTEGERPDDAPAAEVDAEQGDEDCRRVAT